MNPTTPSEAISNWLHPLALVLDPGNRVDWERLTGLASVLDEASALYPVGADLATSAERGRQLMAIREELARRGHIDTTREPAPFQALAQFVCGYRDIDLRDATGLGHGR